jgi:NADH-quinone oxidoreductase subunit G
MPKLLIDGRSIEVAPGTKVIQAAEELGIHIPRLCYHPALGSAGACRLCAVSFLEGPVKGLLMSCMVEAKDGMVVSTQHPDAVGFRKQVMEWLMMNHPHDCPVCDEGGHCVLQEMTVAGGHSMRRYPGAKRTYLDQDLGPLIQHEMNRCIHCWRCKRFYQDYSGYRDLGALGLASRTYFGKATQGPLESPFSGNLIDICPTGVFTDKPSRFRGRRWDYERAPSICIHCSLGCNTVANARYREVLKIEARHNPDVNGYFICDRGRYGFDYTNHPRRPRKPLLDARACSFEEAVGEAGARLQRVIQESGPESVALVGSPRASLESLGAMRLFCETHGLRGLTLWMEEELLEYLRLLLQEEAMSLFVSMGELEKADPILVVGLDPIQEAPMLAMALRQAWRRGAWVGVLDPREVELPFPFRHLAVHPREMEGFLEILGGQAAPASLQPEFQDFLEAWQGVMASGSKPAIVCGTGVGCLRGCAGLALGLKQEKGWGALFPVLPGANCLGAVATTGEDGHGWEELLERLRRGDVRAVVLVETDPLFACSRRVELERALKGLDLVVVLDYLPSATMGLAHVVLPATTLFESPSLWINQEGRLQEARGVHQGGLPLSQVLKNGHPPRLFGAETPGAGPLPAWLALARLSESMGRSLGISDLQALRLTLGERLPWLQGVRPGQRIKPISPEREGILAKGALLGAQLPGDGLVLMLVQATFGTEELSSYSRHARQVERIPRAQLHPETAGLLGARDGDRIHLKWEAGQLQIIVRTKEHMARGVLVIQAHRDLGWEKFGGLPRTLGPAQVQKAG